MGRVINPNEVGKERTQLTRAVVLALRELMRQTEVSEQTKDIAAFISLALETIHGTIDTSVIAWEKRGYWLKADHFRMEWEWAEKLGRAMRTATIQEDWSCVAAIAAQLAEKLKKVDLPRRHRLGTPWIGAWEELNQSELRRSTAGSKNFPP